VRLPGAPQRVRARRRRPPLTAAFDNATEVGRRVGGGAGPSGPLPALRGAPRARPRPPSPCSGNGRGNVEDRVGCRGRSLFVPVPSFRDAAASDRRLPGDCLDPGAGKRRHGPGTPGPGLFGEDRGAPSPLPPAALPCARRETRRRGRQGALTVGGPTATRPGPPARAAGSASPWAPSTSRSATPRPGRWSPPTGASGARPRPTAPTRPCGPGCCARGPRAGGTRAPGRRCRRSPCRSWTRRPPRASPPAPGCCATRAPGAAGPPPWRACRARSRPPAASTARRWPRPAARAAAGDGRVEYGEGVGLGACDGAPGLPGGGGRRAADELGARRRPGVLPRRRQGAPRIGRHHRRLPRLRDARAGRGVHVDARVRGRAPRPGAEGAAARAGEVPRAEVGRGLRLVERLVPGRPGPRGHVLPGVRARRRGPRVLRPDGAREDPHGHRARDRRDLGRLPRGVLADGPAGAAAGQGQEGGDARQAARRRCQGEAAGPGRVRSRALRRGRGEAAVPGDIREPREGGA
jgi:hypothetical protein